MFGFGLYDWLSHPSPGDTCSCQLGTKKTVLSLVTFLLLITMGVVEYLFIDKFHMILPPLAHASLFLVELVSYLIFIHALFSEKKHCFLPLMITQVLRMLILSAIIVFYVARLFASENEQVRAFIPGFEYNDYTRTAKWTGKLLGHLFFVLGGHLFLFYVCYACYKLYSQFHSSFYDQSKPVYSQAPLHHNVIVLEQPIEEAMYGKKRAEVK